jgi:hypothetical protein
MAEAIINGKRVQIPNAATDEDIRQAGGISSGRTLIRREKRGNFVIPRGSRVNAKDNDVFIDAPSRIKG